MKVEKDFACVTQVQILPMNSIPNEIALASNIEIKTDIDEQKPEIEISAEEAASKVPYILNGELYQILARNGENVTVKCCFCPAGRFYRGSVRSTGNFHMHIKRRHPYLLGRLHDMKVASLLERRDRLTKNRKIKRLRRPAHRIVQKSEIFQDFHKLKIKRAFQRHQAEAKGSLQISNHKFASLSTETVNDEENFDEFSTVKKSSNEFNELLPHKTELTLTTKNTEELMSCNAYCDVRLRNNTETMIQVHQQQLNASQETAPTPYPSTYDGSAFGEYSSPPAAAHHVEIAAIDDVRPLDLSHNNSFLNREHSAANSNAYESSGIGLGPMHSDTTVANTISTGLSAIKSTNDNNITAAANIFHNFTDSNWLNLSLILRDIHNDINTRNRIEQNRLLLDIAKFKYLHPGFCFDMQE